MDVMQNPGPAPMRRASDAATPPLLLIVGDDAEATLTIASVLSHFGYTLICSRTIDDAIGVARARLPDLVISHVEFNGRPLGIQLLHGLRAHLPDIPVVLLSADPARARGAVGMVDALELIPRNAPTDLLLAISRLLGIAPHG